MSRFIEIDGEKVPVSEEVYKAYMQPVWREQKRIQRAYKDLNEMDDPFAGSGKILKQSNAGNGSGLHHIKMGLPLSLNQAREEQGFEAKSETNVEEEVAYKILLDELLNILDELNDKDSKAMKLVLIEGLSEREVAKEIGMSRKTVNNRKKKYLPIIQEKLKDWTK
ncbi:sigma factor-like helix-turn-helix DNA-binding protein [Tissierella creatinophila]|uniref:RNA polymerase sigma factor n=1 Tax=Tissierella creatinophila DSM 6911 TaxID=1123403 RepID=A0A1U7M5N0_TISCR|nr:sigma factor-like helix-turn-helix DNA-binding protein [Tissierella creatinophila]OLS02591.1 RNA polymerase sigma factor [Tissierella creatinophila DSM 6911]